MEAEIIKTDFTVLSKVWTEEENEFSELIRTQKAERSKLQVRLPRKSRKIVYNATF